MRFSLVIPCYNEAANLPLLLERCKELTAERDVEVILVDNGSNDNTSEVLSHLLPNYEGCRTVRVETNQGYGFGILSGLNVAEGDILGWTHADMQTDPKDALNGLLLFEKYGEDVFVKGRRYGRSFIDVVFTAGMSVFETLLLAQPMWDINAQPTMFPRRLFENWGGAPHDFALDLYAYYYARKQGIRVHRFPVKFGKRSHGSSHWNINWTAKWKFIRRTAFFSLQMKRNLD